MATRDMVGLVGDGVCVDAREFERLVRDSRLQEAVELCDGELLAGLDEEWVYEARESYRQRLGDVLERLAAEAEAAGALEHAIGLSRRRVELDPLREDAQRELIRRLIAAGELSAARRGLRRSRSPPASGAARAAIARDPPAAGRAPQARRGARSRPPSAPPLPAALRRPSPQPVRRPRRRRRPAPRPVVGGSGRVGSARGRRRRAGNRQDPACQRVGRAARDEGAAVLLGRCHEEVLISYEPFVEAFVRYVAAVPPEVLLGQVGALRWRARPARPRASRGDCASLRSRSRRRRWRALPALRGRGLPAREHFAIVAGRAAARGPALGRQADRVAARARGALDRDRARTVIGTYRDTEPGEPLLAVLADLHRERAVERLRLGSLHRGEVATMVSAWLGRTPPTHFAHALHRETEGNPFFIEEVLRHLIEVAAVDATEWRRLASFTELGIPEGVREAIEQRLAALSPATRRTVTVAAAIGRSFSIEVLEAVAELPSERAARRTRRGDRAPDRRRGARCSATRYSFAHALIRETLYASLSGPRRVGLHRRISAPSSSSGTPRTTTRLSASSHTTSSRPPSPATAAKAVDYSARAARRALAALAYEEAARTLRPRAQGPRACRSPDAATRCDLLLGLGESHEQGERVRPEPRRLPSGRRAGAGSRARRAPRPRGTRPRPAVG